MVNIVKEFGNRSLEVLVDKIKLVLVFFSFRMSMPGCVIKWLKLKLQLQDDCKCLFSIVKTLLCKFCRRDG